MSNEGRMSLGHFGSQTAVLMLNHSSLGKVLFVHTEHLGVRMMLTRYGSSLVPRLP